MLEEEAWSVGYLLGDYLGSNNRRVWCAWFPTAGIVLSLLDLND